MSCGDPHDTNCAEALARMVFFIDNELADADNETIQKHLDDCAPCVDVYALERAVKSLVARSCAEHAPEELRQRVLMRIRSVQVSYTETTGTSEA
jgi:mycothiol system anti-sigma-R factor